MPLGVMAVFCQKLESFINCQVVMGSKNRCLYLTSFKPIHIKCKLHQEYPPNDVSPWERFSTGDRGCVGQGDQCCVFTDECFLMPVGVISENGMIFWGIEMNDTLIYS